MKIVSINNTYSNKNIYFGVKQNKKRRENVDRAATLQDLHEMEDRINEHNEKLIKTLAIQLTETNRELSQKQNRMIGTVLSDISKQIFMRKTASAKDFYEKTKHDSEVLKNSGAIPI